MKWIGLTGGLASGKSTVAQILKKRGLIVLDADQVARDVLKKNGVGYAETLRTFGQDLKQADGEIDRQKLAQIVFQNKEDLLRLEKIIHPLVQSEVQKQKADLEKQGIAWAFYDVPLLFEKNLEDQFDQIVVVGCDLATQKKRAQSRNSWSESEVEARLLSQVPLLEKMKKADFIILNEGSLPDLEKSVDDFLKKLSNKV